MKKVKILVLGAVLVLTVAGLAFAQMDKGMGMGDKGMGMMKGDMMGNGEMMGSKMMGMCPMMGGMMSSMMGKSMVATSDGGVVVLAGNKLTKYDKDLNMTKEVEVKMDMEGMQKNMMDMMKNCPMMKGMMGYSDESKVEESKESAEAEKAEHESHH